MVLRKLVHGSRLVLFAKAIEAEWKTKGATFFRRIQEDKETLENPSPEVLEVLQDEPRIPSYRELSLITRTEWLQQERTGVHSRLVREGGDAAINKTILARRRRAKALTNRILSMRLPRQEEDPAGVKKDKASELIDDSSKLPHKENSLPGRRLAKGDSGLENHREVASKITESDLPPKPIPVVGTEPTIGPINQKEVPRVLEKVREGTNSSKDIKSTNLEKLPQERKKKSFKMDLLTVAIRDRERIKGERSLREKPKKKIMD
jgi:hypothetical protein